ncbi:MAG: DUF1553 domain-containing protein, partial [Planctomycetales bacterium]
IPGNRLALSVVEQGRQAPPTHLLGRGNPRVEIRQVQPGFPVLFGSPDPVIAEAPENASSSHRRKVLANWIASKDNQLTARVMANRMWQHLFGQGIVRTPNNFGLRGSPPSHPELLDWLAADFMKGEWRVKRMLRQIMMSNTYRMSSHTRQAGVEADSANRLLWRQNMRRLSAEEIRDSILAVGGTLNRQMHGPSIYSMIEPEVLHSQSKPGGGWGKSSPEQQARRSIYIHVKRTLITPILQVFDFAETDLSCPVRFETTQPTQALPMLNGSFTNAQAQFLAERARREHADDPPDQVRRILELVWQRPVTDKEVKKGLQLIGQFEEKDGASPEQALTNFALLAINSNEFIYLD